MIKGLNLVQQVIIEGGWRRWPAKEVQRLASEWKPSPKCEVAPFI
jgi:hypothetical protein